MYRGPGDIQFAQEFSKSIDLKLALTAWAKADFDVMHTCGHTASICSARNLLEEEIGGSHRLDNNKPSSSIAIFPEDSSGAEQRNSGDDSSPRSDVDGLMALMN